MIPGIMNSLGIKTLAANWQVWEFAEGATDIEYDGEYGSERVWIVSGRATIEPEDGSPSRPPSMCALAT